MGYNVLLVDDSRMVIKLLSNLLMQSDLPVTTIYTASNGKEAMDVMKDKSIDLVLLDIMMPVMDGIKVLASMREDSYLSQVPVIVISSQRNADEISKCVSQGASFVHKSFNHSKLMGLIRAKIPV